MNKPVKLISTTILGIIFWSLIITLIVKVTENGYNKNDASKQLVAGLIPVIITFFALKLLPTIRILHNWKNLSLQDRCLTIWGLISGDFVFVITYFYVFIQTKSIEDK